MAINPDHICTYSTFRVIGLSSENKRPQTTIAEICRPGTRTVDRQSQTLIVLPDISDLYRYWQSIPKQHPLLPVDIRTARQIEQPIAVVNVPRKKIMYAVNNLHWVNDADLAIYTIRYVKEDSIIEFDELSVPKLSSDTLSAIRTAAWLEIIFLLDNGIDLDRGLLRWQEVINTQCPKPILKQFFGSNQITDQHLCSLAGINAEKLRYLRRKSQKSIPHPLTAESIIAGI